MSRSEPGARPQAEGAHEPHAAALAEVEGKHAAALAEVEGKLTGDATSLRSACAEAEARAASLQAQLDELAEMHSGAVADAESMTTEAVTRAEAEVHAMKERMQGMETSHAEESAALASEHKVRT